MSAQPADTNFNLYIWKENRDLFTLVPQRTKLINKLLAAYFNKQRQVEQQTNNEIAHAIQRESA